MRLPKQVTVCGLTCNIHKVTHQSQAPAEMGETTYGLYNAKTGDMHIREVEGTRTFDTLIHELIHAILSASGADHFVKNEEGFVKVFTPALITTLKDAKLITWPTSKSSKKSARRSRVIRT